VLLEKTRRMLSLNKQAQNLKKNKTEIFFQLRTKQDKRKKKMMTYLSKTPILKKKTHSLARLRKKEKKKRPILLHLSFFSHGEDLSLKIS